jgi:hypothetical protein
MKFRLGVILLISCFAATAQPTQISIIDFYGLRTVKEQDVRKVLQVKPGDSIATIDKEKIFGRLKTLPGVQDAHVALICCDDKEGKWMMFVGISEQKQTGQLYYAAPQRPVKLPDEMFAAYNEFMEKVKEAVMNGQGSEDNSAGHSLMNYPPAKPVQEKMVAYAQKNVAILKDVLHNSGDAEHRQAAAWMIAYAADKKEIVGDLLYAVKDPDEAVRNNVTRALGTIASYANKNPGTGIHIPAEPFIEMANSVVWTDRNKGVWVLMSLTESSPPDLMRQLKEQALPSLIEMARWKNEGHAMMSYMVLGRMAGMKDEESFKMFNEGKREGVISKVSEKKEHRK